MPYPAKYSDAQKEAMVAAVKERGLSGPRVVELAAAGELQGPSGKLAPFTVPNTQVRSLVRRDRNRTRSQFEAEVLALPPKDAIEKGRRDLLELLYEESGKEKRKKAGNRDLERIRQIARVYREVAALPGPGDPRPAKPGARKEGGVRTEGATRTPMAAGILADIGGGEPPRNDTQQDMDTETGAGRSAASTDEAEPETQMDRLPGSLALALGTR